MTLLRNWADINIINKSGACALHHAAKYSDTNMIEFLLQKGLQVNATDNNNKTPLLQAYQNIKNADEVITTLLKHGADINVINKKYGAGALHYTAKYAGKTLVKNLLYRNFLVNSTDNDNETPLIWAFQNKNKIENVNLLLKYGAEINVINKEHGACALHYAGKHSDKEVIQLFLERGVAVNVASSDK